MNFSTIVLSLLIFSVLGISDHWKKWNIEKQRIFHNISGNHLLNYFPIDKHFFVSYNQYSMIGNICHIEFFPDTENARSIFKLATGNDYNVSPLNRRFIYDGDMISDTKFGDQYVVDEFIYVYDSENDELITVFKEDIYDYLRNLPIDFRHWIQFLDKDNWISRVVLRLMPRLDYIL